MSDSQTANQLIQDSPGWSLLREALELDSFNVPAIFKKNQGVWRGIYYKVDSFGEKLKQFTGSFDISIDKGNYHQTNSYIFSDGSTQTLTFEGQFDSNGVLCLESSSRINFRAKAWQVGPQVILSEFWKQEADGTKVYYFETIKFDSENSRSRTTLEYRDGVFAGVNFISEVRDS